MSLAPEWGDILSFVRTKHSDWSEGFDETGAEKDKPYDQREGLLEMLSEKVRARYGFTVIYLYNSSIEWNHPIVCLSDRFPTSIWIWILKCPSIPLTIAAIESKFGDRQARSGPLPGTLRPGSGTKLGSFPVS